MTQDDMFTTTPFGKLTPKEKPRPQRVHENSRKAYHEELPKLDRRCTAIMELFARHPEPKTARQVKEMMGFKDMNGVAPRITKLVDAHKALVEVGKVKCPVTGKTVRVVGVNAHADLSAASANKVRRVVGGS